MIQSTSSTDRVPRPDMVSPLPPKPALPGAGNDQFSATGAAALHAAMALQPEIRPEVVARGRLLAADPTYPPATILRQVGASLLRSPDLSEDQS